MLLTAEEFEHAVSFTSLQASGQAMAREHLVGGKPVSLIAKERGCSRQNVHRASNRALEGWDEYRNYLSRVGGRKLAAAKGEQE